MAYEVREFGFGRYKIRATSGRISHILQREDGTCSVDEDNHRRVFSSFDDALDCAREIAGDPDLPPLTQI